ncbi:MAG TPA: 50S ribosomal protein L35ae [Candidatus Nanoarchaeia archaeon]|nr:50S ribosomal protein L35ae [Candidatus Nanoarchaeia archaeon]
MEGVIASFRRGKNIQTNNQMIVLVKGYSSKVKAKELVGKKAVWESPAKKQIIGKVTMPHGNKGAVRVLFEKGMPGQSLGTKVKIE